MQQGFRLIYIFKRMVQLKLYKRRSFIVIVTLFLFFISCQPTGEMEKMMEEEMSPYEWTLPDTAYDYSVEVPTVVPPLFANNYFDGNQMTPYTLEPDKVTLGRVLFYDKRLSRDNTINCATCHKQELAFSSDSQFSEGIDMQMTTRNSMSLVNLRWNRSFFWDHRAIRLEEQVLQPIQHPEEMDSDLDSVVAELKDIPAYYDLFESAFDSPEITSDGMAEALAHFLRAINSFNSKYDLGRTIGFANFTEQELRGKEVFFHNRCNQCHSGEGFFHALDPRNNGLDLDEDDKGLFAVTGNSADIGKFKTISLRNIGLTAPYMHDGRFSTLKDVVKFYSEDVQAHPNLDDRLTEEIEIGGTPIRLNLSDQQIDDLVAFLHTLTDDDLLVDVRYENPFPN